MKNRELVSLYECEDAELRYAAMMTDITALYNAHGSFEDAKRSVDLIEPGATVFIEGMRISPDKGRLTLDHLLALLYEDKILYGTDSEKYQRFKSQLLRRLDAELNDVNSDEKERFAHVTQYQLIRLIEKDCTVYFADFQPSPDTEDEQSQRVQESLIGESVLQHKLNIFGITPDDGISRFYRKIEEDFDLDWRKHSTREIHATYTIFATIAKWLKAPDIYAAFPKTDDGKIKAYVMYGTAHSRSLTRKLESYGAAVDARELGDEIHAVEYIDSTRNESRDNRAHKIANTVFDVLSRIILTDESADRQRNTLYDQLKEHDYDERAAKILSLRLLRILQRNLTDSDGAFEDYDKLFTRDARENS